MKTEEEIISIQLKDKTNGKERLSASVLLLSQTELEKC
jgi:hypothetical protein